MSARTAAPGWTDAASHPRAEQEDRLLLPPDDAARLTVPMMLRDGVALIVRAIRPDDSQRLRVFHSRLSLEMAERLTHVDYKN